jgi:RND family efflux transporter MFP subunit
MSGTTIVAAASPLSLETDMKTNVVLVVCFAAAMCGLGGCGREEPDRAPRIRPVRCLQVVAGRPERARWFSGTSQAGQHAGLSFRVSGVIKRLSIKVGDRVEAGTVVASLDAQEYELEVGRAEAQLSREVARLRSASAEYDRTKDLYESSNASLTSLDAARANFETARASVDAARLTLEMAMTRLGYTRLQAPVAGYITSIRTEENEIVGPGQVVATLASGFRPEVQVSIPEALIARIQEGDRTIVTFDAIPGEEYGATVSEVGVATDDGRTTYPVTVILDEKPDGVRSGMAAEVGFTFPVPGEEATIIVPAVAVGEDGAGRFVFVVDDIEGMVGTARRRGVKTGQLATGGLEIREGLRDGDILVIRGVNTIADGTQVRLLAERQPR